MHRAEEACGRAKAMVARPAEPSDGISRLLSGYLIHQHIQTLGWSLIRSLWPASSSGMDEAASLFLSRFDWHHNSTEY